MMPHFSNFAGLAKYSSHNQPSPLKHFSVNESAFVLGVEFVEFYDCWQI
ncbi:hypothetical protein [Microcoleus sp. FACHB-68]|nr:hypothetical protein [Microcoleus sp. FACHB-68]MBD1938833.1 hypothetical protein [Microcoleus sp. FACHB-68]